MFPLQCCPGVWPGLEQGGAMEDKRIVGEKVSELGQNGSILDGSEFPSSKMGTNSPTVSEPIESAVTHMPSVPIHTR